MKIAQCKQNDPAVATYYLFDTAGNQVGQIDPRQQAAYQQWLYGPQTEDFTGGTRWAYDQNGRQVSRTMPAVNDVSAGEQWTYDSFGRMLTHVDFEGQSTKYVYDNSPQHGGRLLEEWRFVAAVDATPDEKSVYTYDDMGRMETVTEWVQVGAGPAMEISRGTTTWGYDPIDWQLTRVESPEGVIRYAYDEATGLLTDTWTGGETMASATTHVIYGYDRLGRLASVTSHWLNGVEQADPANVMRFDARGGDVAAEGPTTFYTYDAVGNLDTTTLPNANPLNQADVVEEYDYDELNRLEHLLVSQGSRSIFEQTYTLANDGQRESVLEKRWNADGTSFSSTLSTSAEN